MNNIDTNSLPKLLRREEAAQALGISVRTLIKIIGRGELAATKIGGSTRVRFDELQRFLADQTQRRGQAA
jgi:excisionase family DNA binding protein